MEKRTEKTILKVTLGFLVVLLLGMSTFLVTAISTGKNPVDLISSIRVTEDSGLTEAEESAQLAPLAKITAEQAKTIAISAVDIAKVGSVTDVQVENENGNLVYAVEFTKDGIETDVKIDAGNGKVLLIEDDLTEVDHEDENEAEEDEEEGEDVQIIGTALERASAAALSYIGEGRVTDTEIGDEDSYYEIEITLDNGKEVDVQLDEDFNVVDTEYEDEEEDD